LLTMAQNEISKRAASVLTIAQHKFKQALKKEDLEARLPPVSVELSSQFIADVDAVLKQNTSKCTGWIVKHIAASRTRITSLGDYLVSISKSIIVDRSENATMRKAARSRFAPLLIVNDVLHTDKYHQRSTAKSGIFTKESGSFIAELVELASACIVEKGSQAEAKLRAMLNYWAVNLLVSTDDLKGARERADDAILIAQGGTPVRKRNYLLPEYHGDRNAPWYDLPAAYMLDQMITKPNRPIDPRRIKVAKLDKKPVSSHVRKLLDNYFENIDLKYVPTGDNPTGETRKYRLWLDPMGQLVKQDKESGETNTVCNGYGWSTKLCQDMQKDGVPETIRIAREEAQREEEMVMARPPPQQRGKTTPTAAIHQDHHTTAEIVDHSSERVPVAAAAATHQCATAKALRIAAGDTMSEIATKRDSCPKHAVEIRLLRTRSGVLQMRPLIPPACLATASTHHLRHHRTVKVTLSLSSMRHHSHHRQCQISFPELSHHRLRLLSSLARSPAVIKVEEVVTEAVSKAEDTMDAVGMVVSSVAHAVGVGIRERDHLYHTTAPANNGSCDNSSQHSYRPRHVMASQKRKRTTQRAKPVKRPKYTESSDDESPSEQLWEAERILQEKRVGKKTQYLIQWKGIDPATGEEYQPSWEPEDNPTAALLAEWEARKKQRLQEERSTSTSASVRRGRPRKQQSSPIQSRPGLKSRGVESSPEPSTAHTNIASSLLSSPARESLAPAVESSGVATPVGIRAQPEPERASPKVHVEPPRTHFDPTEYERFSQLAPSDPPSRASQTQDTDLDSSQLFAAVPPFRSSGVVPDSQSSAGEGSFVPPTQHTTGTTQPSSTADNTQEDVTEDSGLLEIVQEAASRANSPARSIPETIYDNTAESQSQRRIQHSPERIEISESEDSIESDSLFVSEHPHRERPRTDPRHQEQPFELGVQALAEGAHSESAPQQVTPPSPIAAADLLEATQPSQDLVLPVQNPIEEDNTLGEASAASGGPAGGTDIPAAVPAPVIENTTTVSETSPEQDLDPCELSGRGQHGILIHQLSTRGAAAEPLRSSDLQPIASQDQPEASLAEHLVPDQAAQFPFHSQHPLHDLCDPTQPSGHSTSRVEASAPVVADLPTIIADAETQVQQQESPSHDKATSLIPASSTTPVELPVNLDELLVSSTHPEDRSHSNNYLEPEAPHARPLHDQPQEPVQVETESIAHSTYTSHETQEETVRRRDFAFEHQVPRSTEQSTASREQNAQAVPQDNYLSTQEDTTENIRPSIEKDEVAGSSSGDSRHDSSQETPERHLTPTKEAQDETAGVLADEPPVEVTESAANSVPAIVTTEPTVPELPLSDEEERMDVSDDDDDDAASLLNDDLSLAVEEHVVPLFIEGRQSDMYSAYIKEKQELLDSFLKDPQGFEPLSQVDEVLSHLRAVETHIDLVFAEAQTISGDTMNPATQINFAAQFGMENSTKFRFLHSLLYALRDQNKHIILVVEEDKEALFNVIETFCKANFIDYNMPMSGRRADPAAVEGALSVSILPGNASPILRPADVIICLDGVQDATQIRTKNWAANPDLDIVPVLHLVIPRTVGHVERYLSSSLDRRERIHTVLASLAQMRGELGKPIDEDTPRAPLAAAQVAEWLTTPSAERGVWPLGSIGSVKDVVEYQTQMSQTSATSPPPTERSKRPHDDEELDPAKRMRFTPQPQVVPGSSINNENEVTRVSDSMPGTARDDTSTLRAKLVRIEQAYTEERALRKAQAAKFTEQEAMWMKQQYAHEDLSKQYRLLLGKHQSIEEKVETMTKNNETLRERLNTRTTEMRTLSDQLTEQRNTHLLSDDAKIAEITKLRTELATAIDEKTRALKTAQTSDSTLEYMKEQYRAAQDAATTAQSTVSDLEEQIKKLTHTASGQPAKLKALHLDRQYETMVNQLKALKGENNILKTSLKQKDEELQRAKASGSRMGVGTRATSATPKPRSRATSPMLGGRLSNLRNG
ncbi:hypothetical protein FB567DRAFT_449438, partial [Paraphoma chrysanthemicola]